MATITFEDGTKVEFDGEPTAADVEEVAQAHGLSGKPSFSKGASTAIQGFGEKANEIVDQRGVSLPSKALQLTGAAAKTVADVGMEGLKAGYRAVVPEEQRQAVSRTGESILSTELGQKALGAISKGLKSWSTFKQKHPEIAGDVEAVVDIASVIPAAKAAELGTAGVKKAATETAEAAAKAGKKAAAKSAAKGFQKEVDAAAEILSPVESKKAAIEAMQANRVKDVGLAGKTTIAPEASTTSLAEKLVKDGVVSSKNSLQKNATNVMGEIKRVSQNEVEPFLRTNNRGFNQKQIESRLAGLIDEKPIHFASEPAGNATYNKVIAEAMKAVADNPKNAAGLWKARKQFDKAVERVFGPAKFSPEGGAINQAIANVRREMNDQIGEAVGDKVFKQYMKHLSDLYDAYDNVIERGATKKAGGVGSTRVSRFKAAHPLKAEAIKYGAAAVGGAAALKAGESVLTGGQ